MYDCFPSPQRWYPVCEQALTLTFGSAGLTTLKKLEESGGKSGIQPVPRGQSISLRVPIEILPGKRYIT